MFTNECTGLAGSESTRDEKGSRATQRDQLLAKLESRPGEWVPLPEILGLRIAQYSARIFELRALGHRIENRREDGKSFFRLVKSSSLRQEEGSKVEQHTTSSAQENSAGLLFPTEPLSYRDPEEGR